MSTINGEPPYTTQEVFTWEAGHDSVTEGANTMNCHFSHFGSERSTKVWEAGRDAALAGKVKPEFDPNAGRLKEKRYPHLPANDAARQAVRKAIKRGDLK